MLRQSLLLAAVTIAACGGSTSESQPASPYDISVASSGHSGGSGVTPYVASIVLLVTDTGTGTPHQSVGVTLQINGGDITTPLPNITDQNGLTNVTWSPDEKYIYIALLNRDQNHMLLNKYSAETGELIKILFEEKSNKYVEPLQELFFLNNDPSRLIWQSQRDGFNHLYLYDAEGKLLKQLTRGPWVVKELIAVNDKGTMVYFMANKDNPLDNLLYNVNLKSGEISTISTEPDTHRSQVSPDGKQPEYTGTIQGY